MSHKNALGTIHKAPALQKEKRVRSERRGHAGRLHGKGKANRANKASGGKRAR